MTPTPNENRPASPRRRVTRWQTPLALLASLLMLATPAHAIDVEAGDYTAAPAGTTLGLLYMQHAERESLYANGDKVAGGGKFSSDVGILRFIHFMELGGYIIDPQILIPFGNLHGSGDFSSLGSNGGFADPVLAATLWTINDPVNRRYLGITPFLYVPVGNYDRDQALNMGENRWRYALQLGYIQGIGDKFTVDLLGDVTFYGDNTDYGSAGATLKQDPTYQFQAFGRYHIRPDLDLRLGVARSWTGRTKVDGVETGGDAMVTKFSIGLGWQVVPRTQLLFVYGRDIKVTDGFKEENRLNLRVAYAF